MEIDGDEDLRQALALSMQVPAGPLPACSAQSTFHFVSTQVVALHRNTMVRMSQHRLRIQTSPHMTQCHLLIRPQPLQITTYLYSSKRPRSSNHLQPQTFSQTSLLLLWHKHWQPCPSNKVSASEVQMRRQFAHLLDIPTHGYNV